MIGVCMQTCVFIEVKGQNSKVARLWLSLYLLLEVYIFTIYCFFFLNLIKSWLYHMFLMFLNRFSWIHGCHYFFFKIRKSFYLFNKTRRVWLQRARFIPMVKLIKCKLQHQCKISSIKCILTRNIKSNKNQKLKFHSQVQIIRTF